MKQLHPIMFAGTGSDVGKSIVAAAFCRIFKQDGYQPAPFKAQNMALNSYATPEGLEIGRAQAVQAEAAGIACHTDMNPLLLKPQSDHTSQVIQNGKPVGNKHAYDYWRRQGAGDIDFRTEVCKAFDRLAARYNPIVMEGAGSISEINLRAIDLVNLPMARHAKADVILVGDIDRGGVFASVYGSIALWAILIGEGCSLLSMAVSPCRHQKTKPSSKASSSISSVGICACLRKDARCWRRFVACLSWV